MKKVFLIKYRILKIKSINKIKMKEIKKSKLSNVKFE